MHCAECGAELKKSVDSFSTRLYICDECFTERVEFINADCEHEYSDKNGKKCIHCGE